MSCGYARNNPVALRDSDGELLDTVLDVGFIAYDLYRVGRAALTGGDVRSELGYLALDLGGAAIPGGTGFGLAARSIKAGKAADKSYEIYAKVSKEGRIYVGRTSGVGTPTQNVARRDSAHHRTEQGYGPAQTLITSNNAPANRGLEQIAQEYVKSFGKLADQIRDISLSNPRIREYLQAAESQAKDLQVALKRLMGE